MVLTDGSRDARDGLLRTLARARGAASVVLAQAGAAEALAALVGPEGATMAVRPLTGVPVRCEDLRARASAAREAGIGFVVDATDCGPAGCPAERLGAQASVVGLGDGLCLVGLARDAERLLPGVSGRIDALPAWGPELEGEARARLAAAEGTWHAASDEAQVVAAYLRCHPLVVEVRYPGLRGDPSFGVAARTLEGGFGPFVDYRLVDGEWLRKTCRGVDPRSSVLALEKALSTVR